MKLLLDVLRVGHRRSNILHANGEKRDAFRRGEPEALRGKQLKVQSVLDVSADLSGTLFHKIHSVGLIQV